MILISHRGNLAGPKPEMENTPGYVRAALALGFDVEVDVWYRDGWFLGHDGADIRVDPPLLRVPGLWIHCKNYPALCRAIDEGLHCFYHASDEYTLTSRGYIWPYPGPCSGGERTICVLPESCDQSAAGFAGVCSDWIGRHHDKAGPVRP